TLHSCSRERSARIASNSSVEAKTRAGARIRPPAGTSQSSSSTRRTREIVASDIERHPAEPDIACVAELQAMVGDRLYQVARPRAHAAHPRAQAAFAQLELLHPLR